MLFAQLAPAQLNGRPWDADAIETLAVEWREVRASAFPPMYRAYHTMFWPS